MSKMKKIIGVSTALAISLTVFAAAPAQAAEGDPVEKFATNSKAAAQVQLNDKQLRDLAIVDNELYSGYGNYGTNIGPVDILSHNLDTGAETNHITVDGEEVNNFREINGKLYAPDIDPKAPWTWNVGYATNESGVWENKGVTPFIHIFDIASTGDDLWLSGSIVNPDKAKYGNSEHLAAVKRSVDGGATWTLEKARASVNPSSNGLDRYYWLAAVNGKMYTGATTDESKYTFDVWENGTWREEASEYYLYMLSGKQVEVIGSTIVMISNGDLLSYNTDTKESKISAGWPRLVKDLYVDKDTETIYAVQSEYFDDSKNSLLKSHDGMTWTEPTPINLSNVPSLEKFHDQDGGWTETQVPAIQSLAVKNNTIYYGMKSGDIYKETLPNVEIPVYTHNIKAEVDSIPIKNLAYVKYDKYSQVTAKNKYNQDITHLITTKTVSKWNGTFVRYTSSDRGETITVDIPVKF